MVTFWNLLNGYPSMVFKDFFSNLHKAVSFDPSASPEQCASIQPGDPNETVSCNFVTRYYYNRVFKPSDGVVTLESASGFPGVQTTFRVEETNHFQLRNSVGTRDALTRLYNGNAGDFWFFTE